MYKNVILFIDISENYNNLSLLIVIPRPINDIKDLGNMFSFFWGNPVITSASNKF